MTNAKIWLIFSVISAIITIIVNWVLRGFDMVVGGVIVMWIGIIMINARNYIRQKDDINKFMEQMVYHQIRREMTMMKNERRALIFNIVCGIIMSIFAYVMHGLDPYTVIVWLIWAWIIGFTIKNYVKTKKKLIEEMTRSKKNKNDTGGKG